MVPLTVAFLLEPPDSVCVSAGLDSPAVYRSVGGAGVDTRQLADTGETKLQ